MRAEITGITLCSYLLQESVYFGGLQTGNRALNTVDSFGCNKG